MRLRREEAAEEKSEAGRGLRKEAISVTKVQEEAPSADVELTQEIQLRSLEKADARNNRFSV